MSEMIGRVAKAIYNGTPRNKPYEQLAAPHARYWEKRAEAAIEAMRDPTFAMKIAGRDYLDEAAIDDVDLGEVAWFWRAMVAAALSKAKTPERA